MPCHSMCDEPRCQGKCWDVYQDIPNKPKKVNMVYVKMCGTWYKYPHRKMSHAEYKEFSAVVNIGKLENDRQEVFTSKATTTEIFELGQQNLEKLDEWQLNDVEAAREVKLKRFMQIITEVLAHQNEAKALCDELFEDNLYGAVGEICRAKPGESLSEGEIIHLLQSFGMPDVY